MSGIFGIFQRDGSPVSPVQLDQQQKAMAPWAVDGSQLWQHGPIGLGHQQLLTTPEAKAERLPTTDAAWPHLTITADVRLDNRPALYRALALPAALASTLPDSALVLHAYAQWGEACPHFLVGAFAFAIWDAAKQQLFCARDHIGFRPFYYYESGQRFIFASDLKAVLAVTGVPQRLEQQRVWAAHLLGAYHLRAHTLWRDIAKLPPATWLTLRPTGRTERCYWAPHAQAPLRLPTLDHYAEQLRAHLQQAVESCLRTEHPVGAHVSGGLDSSAVAALAARTLRTAGRSMAAFFSWSPPPPGDAVGQGAAVPNDERARIIALAEQAQVPCYYVQLTPTQVAQHLARDLRSEPTVPLFCEGMVQQLAAAQGIRVMLSGWGGDEVVSYTGDGYVAALWWCGRWRTALRELRQRRQAGRGSWAALLSEQLVWPSLSGPLYRWPKARWVKGQFPTLAPPLQRLLTHNLERVRTRVGVRPTQRALLQNGHLTQRLEAWAAPYAGQLLDYRYPLLDRRLLEFCLRLPPELYWQAGWKRYLFRYALADLLPPSICWNPSKADPAQAAMQKAVVAQGLQQYQARRRADPTLADAIPCLYQT